MKPKQNCGTCRYSEGWSMTVSGGFRSGVRGKCLYKVGALPVVPKCVVLYESRVSVMPHDGATCAVWEAKP